jgi:hypothetical protein
VNGQPFVAYSKPVVLPEGADVTVRAYADDGYTFKEWRMGETVLKGSEKVFNDVRESLHLEMYFVDENEGSTGGDLDGILLLVAAAAALFSASLFLIWFIFYRRKRYEVILAVSGEAVITNRARRKKAYHFTIDGGSSGTAVYRIGDGGQWKTIAPGENGEYVIPKEDVVDNLTIERR